MRSLSLAPVALVALSTLAVACSSPVAAADGSADAMAAAPAAPAPATKLDLGTFDADATVEIDIPEGTTGFDILVQAAPQDGDFLGVRELRDPSGRVLIQDFLQTDGQGRSQTGSGGTGIGIVRYPFVGDHATDRVAAGKWTARLGGVHADPNARKGAKRTETPWTGRLRASVLLQGSNDGAFHGGALDLDFYVPDGLRISDAQGDGTHTIDATSAETDHRFSQMLDSAFEIAHRIWGIDRGDVRFHRVDASIAALHDQDAIDAANRLATFVGDRPSGQIVLTNLLSPDGDGSVISGVSNCMPGAVGVPGTACSAVVVSLREGMPVWMEAATLVHELGHFVGLEHTTELDGQVSDSLSDTPTCASITEKSALFSCADRDNIMFPTTLQGGSEASVWASDEQKAIWRSSPLFRGTR